MQRGYRWSKAGKAECLAIAQQVRAVYNGHQFDNGWAWLVNDYLAFKCLAEIGFYSSFDMLDDRVIDGFVVISNKINELQVEDSKRGRK